MLTLATIYRVVFDITKDARPDDIAGGWFTAALLLAAGIVLFVVRRKLPAIVRLWFPALVALASIRFARMAARFTRARSFVFTTSARISRGSRLQTTKHLTNRWSQPLAVLMFTFDFMKQS